MAKSMDALTPPSTIPSHAVSKFLEKEAVLVREDLAQVQKKALWRIRLELLWRGLRANAGLFAENRIGLMGVAVIFLFAIMAVAHPFLMATVWDERT